MICDIGGIFEKRAVDISLIFSLVAGICQSSEGQAVIRPYAAGRAEKFPESRKLANVSNLPTFATFVDGKLVNESQTNKAEVLAELVNEIA